MRRDKQSNAPAIENLTAIKDKSPSKALRHVSRYDIRDENKRRESALALKYALEQIRNEYTDIGEIPPVENLDRRMKCKTSLR